MKHLKNENANLFYWKRALWLLQWTSYMSAHIRPYRDVLYRESDWPSRKGV
jgi:hypothetical protein